MPPRTNIPRPTVKRLSLYLRELEAQAEGGRTTINSRQLGEALDLTDAQVRKDLAYFGQFGHPGIGYDVPELCRELRRILGTDRGWRMALVGAGNIGRAVLSYQRLKPKGFEIVEVFDAAAALVGSEIDGLVVRSMDDLDALVRDRSILIGMLAVPADAAQVVADRLVKAGVRGILNFAPRRLSVTEGVAVVTVDLTVSLEQLAFKISEDMPSDDDD